MKFSNLIAGARARKTISWEYAPAQSVTLDLRVLTPLEEGRALGRARAFAVERGVPSPTDDEPLSELGRWVFFLLEACVDTDSPADAPSPFFMSGEEMLKSELLNRDHLAWLYEQWDVWQDECTKKPLMLSEDQLLSAIKHSAEGDATFFFAMPPAMRWSLVRSLAGLLVSLPTLSSTPSSPSPESVLPPPPDESTNSPG